MGKETCSVDMLISLSSSVTVTFPQAEGDMKLPGWRHRQEHGHRQDITMNLCRHVLIIVLGYLEPKMASLICRISYYSLLIQGIAELSSMEV
uniref:Uncharacterized protein n=1 Tax=Salix viminalis TaxID=40686 RepID=A0A6N2KJH5_SALVM